MSHIAEVYAKDLGVKIGKPKITEHFYPIKSEKYIAFQGFSEAPCKNYNYWDVVFKLIKPHLLENDISIVELATTGVTNTFGVDESCSPVSNRHNNYIVSKSLLYLGLDEIYMHVASSYDKPIVALFSNNYKENTKPLWNSKSKTTLLEPDFSEIRPSFATEESKVRINEIKPEVIAQSVLDSLNIKETINFKTKYIGKNYHQPSVEIVPDFFGHSPELHNTLITLRGDLFFDEEKIYQWAQTNHLNLHLKDKISDGLLHAISERVQSLVFYLKDADINYNKFFKKIHSLKISLKVVVEDSSILDDLREKYFDFDLVEKEKQSEEIKEGTFKYLSKKKFVSRAQVYSSEFSSKKLDNSNIFTYDEDSSKELESLYLYE